jgi:hypothetical protein
MPVSPKIKAPSFLIRKEEACFCLFSSLKIKTTGAQKTTAPVYQAAYSLCSSLLISKLI